MNLFGRKKSASQSGPDAAQTILKIRSTVETLEKRQNHLDKKIEQQINEAKAKMAKKDKRGALYCLKRKKMYEAEIEKIQGARLTLEQQMIAIEGTVTNTETVNAMKTGQAAMAAARSNVDADTVGDLMDDIKDEMDQADEIANAISAPANDILNDDDLLAELTEMEELELEAQLLGTPKISTPKLPSAGLEMPAAPTSKPVVAAVEAEDSDMQALQKLEAEMAM